ncbi:hypothetical protein J7T55_013354 [Diaporthe amygdali]|uniref:uncharacterized protein n=1 Tax=Phomopsis amygdali TaxID=1214568 RepID=UPI0022FE0C83|nr:uncharacterized protein J7T55_013354 [Diaporthe amygdali]KAJ0119119.1 hypothetical protein J7T55_013354 [Diaporthe amygdali]
MLAARFRFAGQLRRSVVTRAVSTLSNNPDIKVFPNPVSPSASYLLTYLSAEPPNPGLAIGTTTELPPTPRSFSENPRFLRILNEVLAQHAHLDDDLRAAAKAFASPGGMNLGGGMMRGQGKRKGGSDGAGGASDQGGAGGGGAGGWVHLSDRRNPPDFGRIAWPEDIFGSVQVDNQGNVEGNFQTSGTYRIVTNEGILGLSPYLTEKVIARLKDEDKQERIS